MALEIPLHLQKSSGLKPTMATPSWQKMNNSARFAWDDIAALYPKLHKTLYPVKDAEKAQCCQSLLANFRPLSVKRLARMSRCCCWEMLHARQQGRPIPQLERSVDGRCVTGGGGLGLTSPRSRVRQELSSRTVGSIPKTSPGSLVSLNFLGALNDCISATALPHPVIARNADLVPAWQRWSAWQEGALDGTSIADRMIASTRKNFDQCVDMIKDGLRIDPIWKRGTVAACAEQQLDTSAVFAAAPLMFWRQTHALVELSPALQQLLDRSDLGDDIPIGLLRPPVPACYIRFGEGMQHAVVPWQSEVAEHSRIEGVYVFEAVREEMRAVALVVIWAEDDQATFSVSSININIGDEKETLAAVIERSCAKAVG